MNKKILSLISIAAILTGCSRCDIPEHKSKVNACLKNDTLIWPASKETGDITVKGIFKEQFQFKKTKDGDWYNFLYKITYDNLEVLKGDWKDAEISFLCKHTWPTKESGIMMKALAWPFQENESLIFEIKKIQDKNIIISYSKPENKTGTFEKVTNDSLHTPAINMIGFSVTYPEGWSAHTYFYSDLQVQGGHISGGQKPFVHLVEDRLPEELWRIFYKSAQKIMYQEIKKTKISSDKPVYKIHISYDNGQTNVYETCVGQKYNNQSLDDLADLLQKNERIYIHQKENKWNYK